MSRLFTFVLVPWLLCACVIPPPAEVSEATGGEPEIALDPCLPEFALPKPAAKSDEDHAMASELSLPTPVTFEATMHVFWNSDDFPTDFPPNPHFSPLAGGPHSEAFRLWQPGALSSEAIEIQAEIGDPKPLANVYHQAGAEVLPNQFVVGDLIPSPGSTTVRFQTDSGHTFVSLTSMLAPSPDWFVGISAFPLTVGGLWIEEVAIPLCVWDAGTDDGSTYASADVQPQAPHLIQLLKGYPFSDDSERTAQVGELVLRRID